MAITIDGDNGISGVNGSATTPALQGTDSNTGIAFGPDQVQIATNGSARATVDSSGRFLIGTADSKTVGSGQYSPLNVQGYIGDATGGGELCLSRGEAASSITADDQLGAVLFTDNAGQAFGSISCKADASAGSSDYPGRIEFATTADGASSRTERLRITSGGKIQVTGTRGGTLQPSDNDSLELFTSANNGNSNTGCGLTFYNHDSSGYEMGGTIQVAKSNGTDDNTDSYMRFSTRANGSDVVERMRVSQNGEQQHFGTLATNINIANTAGAGNTYEFFYCQHSSTGRANGTNSFRVATDGDVFNTNNSYGSLSDQRLKENIVDATSQWDDIKALQVRKYNFREDTGHETHTQLGLIAQEVESVSPGLVETTDVREGETVLDADGNQLESTKSINYSVLYMKAVKALQEAMDRIETLETKVAALEAG